MLRLFAWLVAGRNSVTVLIGGYLRVRVNDPDLIKENEPLPTQGVPH